MKCTSGKHDWMDPISAKRCCNPKWQRAIRLRGKHSDLDLKGRTYSTDFVHGWVRKAVVVTRPSQRIVSRLYPYTKRGRTSYG